MLRFLRQTLLFTRLSDARAAYVSLRRAQHRESLRTKRAAVRARVLLQLQLAQLRAAESDADAIQTAARVRAVRIVAEAREARRAAVRALVEGRDVPAGLVHAVGGGADVKGAEGNGGAEEFKRGVVQSVVEVLSEEKAGGPASRMVGDMVRESVEEVELEEGLDREAMNVKLIAGVARRAGVGWEEMEGLLDRVETDEEKREGLRMAVREAMMAEQGDGSTAQGSRA